MCQALVVQFQRGATAMMGMYPIQLKVDKFDTTLLSMTARVEAWFVEKGLPSLAGMQLSRVLQDPREFMRKLWSMMHCFNLGPSRVSAETNYLDEVLASLIETDVVCSERTIFTFMDYRIHVSGRGENSSMDCMVKKVCHLLEQFFGRMTLDLHESTGIFTTVPPAGVREWQRARAREICTDLNVYASAPSMDMNTVDTLVTADGWVYQYQSKSWVRNSLRAGYLRVCGKTRAQLEDLSTAHKDLAAVKDFIHFWISF